MKYVLTERTIHDLTKQTSAYFQRYPHLKAKLPQSFQRMFLNVQVIEEISKSHTDITRADEMTDGRTLWIWDLGILCESPAMELSYLHGSVNQLRLAEFYEFYKFYEKEVIQFFTSMRIQTIIQHLVTNK